MARKHSAGILLYRRTDSGVEVLICHMGGPFWSGRDERAWTIPKGEYEPGEEPLVAARREFEEELGSAAPHGALIHLGDRKQAGGKVVSVWAAEGDLDVTLARSSTFPMEWPPGSGHLREFPEVDRATWTDADTARTKLVEAQAAFIDRLLAVLRADHGRCPPGL